MALKQISVFVANQTGSLEKLVNILAEAGVDMRAMSIADTQEFGIMRMIVKGNTKACEALRNAGYLVNVSHVTAVEIPDEPGGLAKVVSILAGHGVNIEYTYAFMTRSHGKACVVFRVEDNECAENILAEAGVDMRAMSIADTQEFGIMRMIVKGNTKACEALRNAGYLVNVSHVTAVEIPDEPGGLAKVVSILAGHGVNIEYTYAFMTRSHGKACVVFRVEDNECAENILAQHGIVTLSHLVAEDAPI